MSADFEALRAKFRAQAQDEAPRKARKQRETKRQAAVDGRSLRAKGRTAQLNTRVRPELRDRLQVFAKARKTHIANVIEAALESYLEAHGHD